MTEIRCDDRITWTSEILRYKHFDKRAMVYAVYVRLEQRCNQTEFSYKSDPVNVTCFKRFYNGLDWHKKSKRTAKDMKVVNTMIREGFVEPIDERDDGHDVIVRFPPYY